MKLKIKNISKIDKRLDISKTKNRDRKNRRNLDISIDMDRADGDYKSVHSSKMVV